MLGGDGATGDVKWVNQVPGGVSTVTYSSDSSQVLVGDDSGAVTSIASSNGQQAWQASVDGSINSVALSPNASRVVVGDA